MGKYAVIWQSKYRLSRLVTIGDNYPRLTDRQTLGECHIHCDCTMCISLWDWRGVKHGDGGHCSLNHIYHKYKWWNYTRVVWWPVTSDTVQTLLHKHVLVCLYADVRVYKYTHWTWVACDEQEKYCLITNLKNLIVQTCITYCAYAWSQWTHAPPLAMHTVVYYIPQEVQYTITHDSARRQRQWCQHIHVWMRVSRPTYIYVHILLSMSIYYYIHMLLFRSVWGAENKTKAHI